MKKLSLFVFMLALVGFAAPSFALEGIEGYGTGRGEEGCVIYPNTAGLTDTTTLTEGEAAAAERKKKEAAEAAEEKVKKPE